MPALLVAVPLIVALIAFLVPSNRARPWLLPAGSAIHLALVVTLIRSRASTFVFAWLVLDDLSTLLLAFTSVLFFFCAVYAVGYLHEQLERDNRIFVACLAAFLGMMTLMIESHHLGLMWVALEGATLSSAPLIYFHRTARSLEAVWKYLLVGSVGIALALFGSFFLAYSAHAVGLPSSLVLEDLVADAPHLSRPWLRAAFVTLFVGYGTKMGLAPMHTWKPDAYGEAPGLVGTLLAGGLTNCAFLAILRFFRVVSAAGDAPFARELMIALGLFSMAVAGIFMARQHDYKRMLAYSSVEHMGILVLGIGIGGAGVFGSLLHLINNGFTKGVLFLSAGNIHRAFGSKLVEGVSGALRRVPASGTLFVLGFFAITGSPPFGPFLSEFTILNAAATAGRYAVGGAFLLFLAVVFVGMGSTVLAVAQGTPKESSKLPDARRVESFFTVAPAVACLVIVLALGLWLPAPLGRLLHGAAAFVDGPRGELASVGRP